MSHVPIIAATSATSASNSASSRAAELAKQIQDTIDGYRAEHPRTKDLDVRRALHIALRRNRCKLDDTDPRPLLLLLSGIILLLLLGVASFVFFTNRGY